MVRELFGLVEGILTLGWGLNGEMDGFDSGGCFLKMKISNWPEVYRILNATIHSPDCNPLTVAVSTSLRLWNINLRDSV